MTQEMLFNNSSFSRYNGQYVMLLNILHDRFGPQYFDKYEQLMKKHQMIWRKLYANYPSVILESNYSNTDAIDSQGLYLAASNYFKDLYNPERQYNITIIDVNHKTKIFVLFCLNVKNNFYDFLLYIKIFFLYD